MAHKTLTISEEAYYALARLKAQNESFTAVILRLAKKRASHSLLDYLRSMPPDEELASLLEGVLDERKRVKLGAAGR